MSEWRLLISSMFVYLQILKTKIISVYNLRVYLSGLLDCSCKYYGFFNGVLLLQSTNTMVFFF